MSDRYQIQGKIGQGGLGAVYKAFDTQLKREVALKRVLTPEQASRDDVEEAAEKLMQEATVLSTLNHPNIVTVFDVGQDESGGFVVMELLDGETLDQTISRGLLTLEDFTEVVNQTLEALIAAQAVNMMHRDLKPSNVMVIWRPSGKFQVKVLDFGLAKISESPSVQTIDQGDAILGSIYFMAPEQFERRRLDFRTDMYAMGCIYYNTLTGKYPFDGDTAPQVMAAHLQHKVKPLQELRPDLPEEVSHWVMWLINRDMNKRPADAREALERFPDVTSNGSGPVYVTQQQPPSAGTGPQTTTSRTGRYPGTTTGSVGSATSHVNPATQAYGLGEQQTAKSKQMTIVLISLIVGSIIVAVGIYFMVSSLNSAQDQKRFAELYSLPQGNKEDVSMLVRYLNPDNPDPRAVELLSKLEGQGVEDAVVLELTNAKSGPARIDLLEIVANRDTPEAFPIAYQIAQNTTLARERSQAVATACALAGSREQEELIELLALSGLANEDRRRLEDRLIAILLTDPSVETRANRILGKMDSASGEERKSYCRIVGSLGGKTVLARLERVFNEADMSYKGDAMAALNVWPDRSATQLLIKLVDETEEAALKVAATRAYIRIISLPSVSQTDGPHWDRAFAATDNINDINKIFLAILDRPVPATLNYLENATIKGAETLQQKAIERIKQDLSKAVVLTPGEMIPVESFTQIKGNPEGADFAQSGSYVDNWTDYNTWVQWLIDVKEPGTYEVEVFMSCGGIAKSRYIIYFAGHTPPLNFSGQPTGTWESFRPLSIQRNINIPPNRTGPQLFVLAAKNVVEPRLMNVKGIRFTKVK